MYELLPVTYSHQYVLYSYLISVIGCFVGLIASSRILLRSGKVSRANALSAGMGIGGVGVWSMHFMGMLAVNFDLAKGYAFIETFASFLAVVIVTTVALIYAFKNRSDIKKICVAGLILGLGICVMHYLGMYGMRFGGFFQWDWRYVALSILIAVGAATAALYLATHSKKTEHRFAAALVMAFAICAMHYTGMYAADIVCTTTDRGAYPQGFGIIMSGQIPLLLLLTTTGLLFVLSADQLSQTLSYQPSSTRVKRYASTPRVRPVTAAHSPVSKESPTSPLLQHDDYAAQGVKQ